MRRPGRSESASDLPARRPGAAALLLTVLGPAVLAGELRSFRHLVSVADLNCHSQFCTTIQDPCLNAHDGSRVLFTHFWNPPGQPTRYLDQAVAFDYDLPSTSYRLTTAADPFELGTGFHVIALCGEHVAGIQHTTTAITVDGHETQIEHGVLNAQPGVQLWVSLYSPPQDVLASPLGVTYDTVEQRWRIFREDLGAFPVGESLWVLPTTTPWWEGLGLLAHTHVATAGNTFGNYTLVDHPELNGRPGAVLIVTQLRDAAAPVANDHHVGVYYDFGAARWGIFNEDLVNLPMGARFFVAIATLIADGDFETGDLSSWIVVD